MPAALLQHHEQREIQHWQGLSRTWNHYSFPPVIFKPQAAGPDGDPCCRSNTESFPFSSHPAEAFLMLSLLLQVEVPMGPLERHSPVFFCCCSFHGWLQGFTIGQGLPSGHTGREEKFLASVLTHAKISFNLSHATSEKFRRALQTTKALAWTVDEKSTLLLFTERHEIMQSTRQNLTEMKIWLKSSWGTWVIFFWIGVGWERPCWDMHCRRVCLGRASIWCISRISRVAQNANQTRNGCYLYAL